MIISGLFVGVVVGLIFGFWAATERAHRTIRRLRSAIYWLSPPFTRQREDWFDEENTWRPKE
jgi:hypothetical protein